MTEKQWLACKAPRLMVPVAQASARASDRTRRLYVAAYWGLKARWLPRRQRLIFQRQAAATEHWAETGRLPKGRRESRSESVVFFNRDARAALDLCVPSQYFELWD